MEEGRSASKTLTGKPTGKRPLGRLRRRWEDNVIMELIEASAITELIQLGTGIIREPL